MCVKCQIKWDLVRLRDWVFVEIFDFFFTTEDEANLTRWGK